MWPIDGGVKWRGYAINGQYYFRWLSSFLADGPLPLSSTFDNGGELSVSQFIIPNKLKIVLRGHVHRRDVRLDSRGSVHFQFLILRVR